MFDSSSFNQCPSPEELVRFVAGTLPQPRTSQVADHLLQTDCAACRAQVYDQGDLAWRTDQLEDLWKKVLRSPHIEQQPSDCVSGRSKLDLLLEAPAEKRALLIRNRREFKTLELCFELIDLAWDHRLADAAKMLEFSSLAVEVAEALAPSDYPEDLILGTLGRALAHNANAHKVVGKYRQSEQTYRQAYACLERAAAPESDLAECEHFWASLCIAQSRHEEMVRLTTSAIERYRAVGDDHCAGWVMSTLARGYLLNDQLAEARDLMRESLLLIDPSVDESMMTTIRQNLAVALHELGELENAEEEVAQLEAAYKRSGDHLALLRVRWLHASIAQSAGHVALAEKCLLEARNGFVAAGLGVDAAHVTLELACLYSEQQRTAEVNSLAEAIIPIFRAEDLDREFMAALLLFRDATLKNQLTAAMLQGLMDFFDARRVDKSQQLSAFVNSKQA